MLKGESSITTNALEGLKVVDIIERIYEAGNSQHNIIQPIRRIAEVKQIEEFSLPIRRRADLLELSQLQGSPDYTKSAVI